MSQRRLIVLGFAALLVIAGLTLVAASYAAETSGLDFSVTIQSPGQDSVVLSGAVLGSDMKLRGVVGGIETIDLLSGGKLYVLTAAIKTAREIDNPAPPAKDSADWVAWLLEPGRVNPASFARAIGQAADVSGDVAFGADSKIKASFDKGILSQLVFPSAKGSITYTYSDFHLNKDLTASDFAIPADYQK